MSISKFVSELKSKAKCCGFGNKEDSFICAMLINKVNNVPQTVIGLQVMVPTVNSTVMVMGMPEGVFKVTGRIMELVAGVVATIPLFTIWKMRMVQVMILL